MGDIGVNKKVFNKIVDLRKEAALQQGLGDALRGVTGAWAFNSERNRQAQQSADLANRLGVGGEAFTPEQMIGVNPGILLNGLINTRLASDAQQAYYDRAIGVEHMKTLREQAERAAVPTAKVQTPFGVFDVPIKSPSDLKTASELQGGDGTLYRDVPGVGRVPIKNPSDAKTFLEITGEGDGGVDRVDLNRAIQQQGDLVTQLSRQLNDAQYYVSAPSTVANLSPADRARMQKILNTYPLLIRQEQQRLNAMMAQQRDPYLSDEDNALLDEDDLDGLDDAFLDELGSRLNTSVDNAVRRQSDFDRYQAAGGR